MATPEEQLKALTDALGKFDDSISSAGRAIKTFSTAGFGDSDILGSMVSSVKIASASIDSFKSGFGSISSVATTALDAPLAAFKALNDSMLDIATGVQAAIEVYDNLDSGLRSFTTNQYKLGASIGATFDESEKFATSYRDLIKSNSDLSRTGFWIKPEDLKNTVTEMQKLGITVDDVAEKTGIFGKEMSYAQGMTLQAKAMGMDVGSYTAKIAGMVRTNGMSMEESMKLMANSQDIARSTGLKVDEVTGSLDRATSGFAKMGMTMDFGRPILKGFADSIKDVGLGIAQAGDLAATFTKSLGDIINNPALAYITSMKGGMAGMGGGGILNPSIQMQASMLDSDPSSKAKMAKDLSEGMRDTLKSFTGGDIVTVKQAAQSPELQTKFYTQQQMLGSTFGISGTDNQNRVLEYLADLEDATAAGDDKSAELLQKQISDALQGTDKTMSLQEKMSANMEKDVMVNQEHLQIAKFNLTKEMGPQGMDKWNNILAAMDKATRSGDVKEQEEGERLLKEFVEKMAADAKEVSENKIQTGSASSSGEDKTNAIERSPQQAAQTINFGTLHIKTDQGTTGKYTPPPAKPGSAAGVVPVKVN